MIYALNIFDITKFLPLDSLGMSNNSDGALGNIASGQSSNSFCHNGWYVIAF